MTANAPATFTVRRTVFASPRRRSRRLYQIGKRVFDVVVAASALLLLAPLLLAIAAAVRLDSAGPALYVQTRLGARPRPGADGTTRWEPTPFRLYKFRSMRVDADAAAHRRVIDAFVAGVPSGCAGARFKPVDPAITRVGRFLRATSLDELPQLLNVVKGDMSLVGPRPVPVYEAEHHVGEYRRRYCTRPGLSGPWQVSGRADTGFAEMMRLDLAYVDRQSFLLDLRILLRTIPAVLTRRGVA